MVVDIKWCVVALIPNHVLTVIVFKLITVLVGNVQKITWTFENSNIERKSLCSSEE